jgi:AraC-like DNA-binding protein/mannose-6-phosphate isomerase-like protein (cupin superfamily)
MKNFHKYFHISAVEEQWGFYVTTAGYNRTDKKRKYPNNEEHPPDHSFSWNKGRILNGYYIVFITSGEGIFESAETKAYKVKAGHCFFLFPGVWHRYKPDLQHGWEEYWIGFKGPYPDMLMKNGFFSPQHPFVNVGHNGGLLKSFQSLLDVASSAPIGYHQIICGYTLQILGMINAINQQEEHDQNPLGKLVSKAKFLMQASLEDPVNIEALVSEFPISYSKFRKSFKELTGQSPNQYHLDLRLKKAKELLDSTALSVSEIAYKTGFESAFYFSRLFKNKNGTSPKLYRAQSQGFGPLVIN